MLVYWGRFNPPHKGHLRVIARFSKRGALTVAVGGAEKHDTKRDPFSGAERGRMLRAALREAGIHGVRVICVRDGPTEATSTKYLRKAVPQKSVICLSDEKAALVRLVRRHFPVRVFRRLGAVSSTRVRDAIAAGKPWEHLTTPAVARLIRERSGIARIKRAYQRSPRSSA